MTSSALYSGLLKSVRIMAEQTRSAMIKIRVTSSQGLRYRALDLSIEICTLKYLSIEDILIEKDIRLTKERYTIGMFGNY